MQRALAGAHSAPLLHPPCALPPTATPPAHAPTASLPPHPAEHLLFLLNFLNTSAALLAPCAIILHTRAELLPGFALTMAVCILWLKLVSYAHVNWDYRWVEVIARAAGTQGTSRATGLGRRPAGTGHCTKSLPATHPFLPARSQARRRGEVRPGERGGADPPPEGVAELLRYPENISLPNLAYFLAAPTLCYQPVYPRRWAQGGVWSADGLLGCCAQPTTLQVSVPRRLLAHPRPALPRSKRFRARWMVKRLFMLTLSLGLMLFVTEQYIQPTIDNSLRPLREMVRWLCGCGG